MKTFTARQLGNNRAEMRQEIRNGGCILQYKNSDRTVDMECVIIPMDEYKSYVKARKKLRNDPRKQCECIVWDGTICLRPAAWLTEKNELLCDLHGGLCRYSDPIGHVGEPSIKGIEIVNTKDNPYIVT